MRAMLLFRLQLVIAAHIVLLAAASNTIAANEAIRAEPQRIERDGVAVEFSIVAASPTDGRVNPIAGHSARVRFRITDTTSGKPLPRLHPAAWLSRRSILPGELKPRTAAEKVQELLGGSIFSKADVDFNTFRVLALNEDATVTVVDPLFGFGGTKLLALVALPGVGTDWAFSGDQRLLYVSSASAGTLSAIDTANWTVTETLKPCAHPGRLSLQPDAHYLWVACQAFADSDQTSIAVIDADRSVLAARISLGAAVDHLAVSADNRWAFAGSATEARLSVIDVHHLKKLRDIRLNGPTDALAYSARSDAIYLAQATTDTIAVIDAQAHELVAHIKAESGVSQVRFAPGDRYAFMTVPSQNLVLILDAVSNRIVQRASIDANPEQLAFSSDMAFVRRQGTASVGMIPLNEIGHPGKAVPVAEFMGGDSAFGIRTSLADSMIAAPGETAVLVANPRDQAIYFYMEGMAAPMGTFANYDREPRAVQVLDRSLREVAPGVYESSAVMPAADDYDAVFFLAAPRIVHAFSARIVADPQQASTQPSISTQLLPLPGQTLEVGRAATLNFKLAAIDPTAPPPEPPTDLMLRAVLAPGVWHQQKAAEVLPDGSVRFEFTPPRAGLYYFYATSAAMDQALAGTPCLVLSAKELINP